MLSSYSSIERLLTDRFRCPSEGLDFEVAGDLHHEAGYFRFGSDIICYGQCSSGNPALMVEGVLHDASEHIAVSRRVVRLPFDPRQVADNLCNERYARASAVRSLSGRGTSRNLYYALRPFLPVRVRKYLQRIYLQGWKRIPFPKWPVDRTVDRLCEEMLLLALRSQNVESIPFVWFWPDAAPSCTIVTHDVETACGMDFCSTLMDLDDCFGIKSSFQLVPEERYQISASDLENIRGRGFEINVQDWNHDGRLFEERTRFLERANRINECARNWGAVGFRSAILYRNTDWYDALQFSYDMSIPNVAHLDPQRGGCCTVFPFFIGDIVELPVTTIQDYSLFHILNDYSSALWQQQISTILKGHGLISIPAHPDYLIEEKPRAVYTDLLRHLSDLRAAGETWIALPKDVAAWWRLRSGLTLVKTGDGWSIQGKGSERAALAYARLVDGRLQYEIPSR